MRSADRIDFISAYCDRWCERCAYTSRCSAFAVKAAIAMSGDAGAGVELALGSPHPVQGTRSESGRTRADVEYPEMTAQEDAAMERDEEARRLRVGEQTIMKRARIISMVSYRWLHDRAEAMRATADDVLREALAVAQWDVTFVPPKLGRALDGLDRHDRGEDPDDDPLQNDRNGSAKVALIALERSEAAWHVIAQSTGDAEPATLAEQIAILRRLVESTFPDARSFIRPGFDEPDP
jgi:hypothetical protein